MRVSLRTLQGQGYFTQLVGLTQLSLVQLAGTSSHGLRDLAVRQLLRQSGWVLAGGGVLVLVLMFGFDATEIRLMPPRGAPELWPLRILTDFGKDVYVISTLAVILVATVIILPAAKTSTRARLLRLGAQLEYLLLAVSFSVLTGEVVKWAVGRGRPFVGDSTLTFLPFHGAEPYLSFPSGHAVTASALAFAVAAVWPRTRIIMVLYALVIVMTRLVLLAHHPSDVIGGAVIGITGAMAVRYWFAARKLGFAIDGEGGITPR